MVIYIEDYLGRRRDAARQAPARLFAVAGGQMQAAIAPRLRDRLHCVPTLVSHEQLASTEPGTMPDVMMLYAEATLV